MKATKVYKLFAIELEVLNVWREFLIQILLVAISTPQFTQCNMLFSTSQP